MRFFSVSTIISFLLLFAPLQGQKKYTETIKVEAWTIPIFAVDLKGLPVLNLKASDLNLFVNNKRIANFSFFKKSFVTEQKADPGTKSDYLLMNRKKSVILLFDTATSKATSIMRLKSIAKDLVSNASPDLKFIVLNIVPFKGLTYIGGPTIVHQQVLNMIDEIDPKHNYRYLSRLVTDHRGRPVGPRGPGKGSGKSDGSSLNDYGPEDDPMINYPLLLAEAQKSGNLPRSFEDLYYAINSLKGIKFIYLFSEGVSSDFFVEGNHMAIMYKYLRKCSSFLFCINPSGASAGTGEEFLKSMARITGGKYVYGRHADITESINNVHQAYYELAFVTPDEIGNDKLINVEIKSKRGDIKIHSIRSLEKSKQYQEMNQIEKQVMVLNLITKNPLYNIDFAFNDIKILEKTEKAGNVVYKCEITGEFLNRKIDLYKIQLRESDSDTIIREQTLIPKNNRLEIKFKKRKGYSEYFAMVNPGRRTALLKAFQIPVVKLGDIKLTRDFLQFNILGYKLQNFKGTGSGFIKLSIRIWDNKDIPVFNTTQSIVVKGGKVQIRIPFKLWKAKYNVLILADDMLTGHQEKSIRSFSIH